MSTPTGDQDAPRRSRPGAEVSDRKAFVKAFLPYLLPGFERMIAR